MYPSLPGYTPAGSSSQGRGAYGAAPDNSGGASASRPPLQSAGSAEASPWSSDTPSVLRVKIADEYRLDPLVSLGTWLGRGGGRGANLLLRLRAWVMMKQQWLCSPLRPPRVSTLLLPPPPPASQIQVPPALEASARPVRDFDFEYERTVMQAEASGLVERFLAKPEDTHYAGTKVGKFLGMGYAAPTVHLALAYQAATRGDEAQVVDFCNNYTQLLGMGFGPALAAGALVRAKNDAAAAAELCLAATS
jgi:hypothetical protein